MEAFKFNRDEWPSVLKEFEEQQATNILGRKSTFTTRVDVDSIHLQFCGWEIVLLPDGNYFINDTSGG